MKVENSGVAPWVGRRVECKHCGFSAMLDLADRDDVHSANGFWISCPTCRARVDVGE